MKNILKTFIGIAALILVLIACKKQEYSMGDLTAPSNVVINAVVVGVDATHPNGDGSGQVNISITADNALTYNVDYDANDGVSWVNIPKGTVTKKYTATGVYTYRITALVYGVGGTSSTATKDITVRSDFSPPASLVTNLTNDASKTWVVDAKVAGHFGVGPFTGDGSTSPVWWSASIDEKVACCNCFYTSTFTFTKVSSTNYTLKATCPDGAFTKTGSLTTLPGIPSSGAEGCYTYSGGTSAFAFAPASSGIATPTSTQVSIMLAGVNTFIGYGAVQKEYEILELTPTYMYLRVQGTETGNAWYLKLKPV